MQSNENNEFSGARCVAGWVRVANAAPKPPIASGGYKADTICSFPVRRVQCYPSSVICIKRILVL
jgi:hypothetical protein